VPIRPKRPAVIVASLAIIGVIGGIATATATSSRPAAVSHIHRTAVPVRLRRAFSVLVSHRSVAHNATLGSTEHPLPAAVANVLPREVSGVNASEAVFAGGTYPTWVVPGANEICLVAGTTGTHGVPSSICGAISWAEQHGLAIVTEHDKQLPVVLGLAPNGNSSVQVTEADGATQSVAVINNVYEIVGGNPKSVTLKGLSGALWHRAVGMPSSPPEGSPPSR
jgi:hypothetical protein